MSYEDIKPYQWKPGQSGNPNGRPKKVEKIKETAIDAGEDMLKVLIAIANDEKAPQSARVAAATKVLEHGPGKPKESVEVNHARETSTLEEVQKEIKRLMGADVEITNDETENEPGASSPVNGAASGTGNTDCP